MAEIDGKDVALVGGAALLLYLILGKSEGAIASIDGTIGALSRECQVYFHEDGTPRWNDRSGRKTTLAEIRRTCAERIAVNGSGAARTGDLLDFIRALEASGFQVLVNDRVNVRSP